MTKKESTLDDLVHNLNNFLISGGSMSKKRYQSDELSSLLRLLGEVDQAILSSTIDLDRTFQTILDGSLRLIDGKYGNIMILEDDELVIKGTTTRPKEKEIGTRLDIYNSISGLPVLKKETIVFSDVSGHPLYHSILKDPNDEPMVSEVAVPLIKDDKVIGVLNIESPTKNDFTSFEVELLEILAGQAAIAIIDARRHKQLEMLREIDRLILNSDVGLNKTLQFVLDLSIELLGARYGNLLLVEGDELVIKATTSPEPDRQNELGTRLKINDSVSGLPIIHKKTIIIPDVDKEPLYKRVIKEKYIRSEMATRLIVDNLEIGVINIESSMLDAFTVHDGNYLETLAGQAAIAIQNARNQEMLTELRIIDQSMLSSSFSLETVLDTILVSIRKLIDGEFCDILILEGDQLAIKACTIDEIVGYKLEVNNSICGLSVINAGPVNIQDTSSNPLYKHIPGAPKTKSELVVPMIINDDVIGVINIENVRLNAYTMIDEEILLTLSGQCALAIRTAQFIEEIRQADLIKANKEIAKWVAHRIGGSALDITWPLERLQEKIDQTDQSAVEEIQRIKNSVQRIVNLKTTLMKPIEGESVNQAIDITDVLENAIQSSNTPRDIVELKIADGLPKIKGNFAEVSELFSELFVNAVNALEQTIDKEIRINAYIKTNGKFIEVKFSDNGCGIHEENIDQIFILGFTTRSELGGTGYGLYMCTQLLRKMNGSIYVESDVGKGTIFTLRLPVWE